MGESKWWCAGGGEGAEAADAAADAVAVAAGSLLSSA